MWASKINNIKPISTALMKEFYVQLDCCIFYLKIKGAESLHVFEIMMHKCKIFLKWRGFRLAEKLHNLWQMFIFGRCTELCKYSNGEHQRS